MQSKDTELKPLTIKHGTLAEWEDSDKNPNDIVFLTDVEEIRAHGKSYGGDKIWKLNKETGGIHTEYSVDDYANLYGTTVNNEVLWWCNDRSGNPIEFQKDQIIQLKDSDGNVLDVTIIDVVTVPWGAGTYYKISPQLDTNKTYTYGPFQSEVTNQANGYASVAEGYNTKAEGDYSHAEGVYTKATGYASHAEGDSTEASGDCSHVEGNYNVASGTYSHVEGSGNTGCGDYSHVEGSVSTGCGFVSHAEGGMTMASGEYSHSEGRKTVASGYASHAEGYDTTASGQASHAEGSGTTGTGDYSHAEGDSTVASGYASHSEGRYTEASGSRSHAEGSYTDAVGSASHSEGSNTEAYGDSSHAEGDNTTASGYASHSEGRYTEASGDHSHAEGEKTIASGLNSHAEGQGSISALTEYSWESNSKSIDFTSNPYLNIGSVLKIENNDGNILVKVTAVSEDNLNVTVDKQISLESNNSSLFVVKGIAHGDCSHAEGQNAIASGSNSHAEGRNTKASGDQSHAEGTNSEAIGKHSHAEGFSVEAIGNYSHAEGSMTEASGGSSHAEGTQTKSEGYASHAEGGMTMASGDYSHAEGTQTKSEGWASHAEGSKTIASGNYSHAEGVYNKNGDRATMASGLASHAEGAGCQATGSATHAEGVNTTASGEYSHAEGEGSVSYGRYSHAEGRTSQAYGNASHTEGYWTVAKNIGEHAEGSWNKSNEGTTEDQKTLSSIGIGTSEETRKNAQEVMQNGDFYVIGIGGYDGANIEEEGVKTLQEVLEDISDGSNYAAGENISIEENVISALGYRYNKEKESFATGNFRGWGNSTATGESSFAEGCSRSAGICSHSEGMKSQLSIEIKLEKYNDYEYYTDYGLIKKCIPVSIYETSGNYLGTIYNISEENIIINDVEYCTFNIISDNNPLNIASGNYVLGFITGAYGDHSHSEGHGNIAEGENSHAEGYRTEAEGENSHAEGEDTEAYGLCSHVEGSGTTGTGSISHAEGHNTTASSWASHAEGYHTEAYGLCSHAEGCDTIASGNDSHSEGGSTKASGYASHAEGYETEAKNDSEHAQGRYNISHTSEESFGSELNTVHSIGIGDKSTRKNAQEVMQNGDYYVIGIGGYDGTNPKEATRLQDVVAEHPKVQNELTYSDDGQTLTSHPLLYNDMLVVDTEEDYNKCTEIINQSSSEILKSWTVFGSESEDKNAWGYCSSNNNSPTMSVNTVGGNSESVPVFRINEQPQDYIFNVNNTGSLTGYYSTEKFANYDYVITTGIIPSLQSGGLQDYQAIILALSCDNQSKNAYGISLYAENQSAYVSGRGGDDTVGNKTIKIIAWKQGDLNVPNYQQKTILTYSEGLQIIPYNSDLNNSSGVKNTKSSCIQLRTIRQGNILKVYSSKPYRVQDENGEWADDSKYSVEEDLPITIDLLNYKLSYKYYDNDNNIVTVNKDFSNEQIVKDVFNKLRGAAYFGYEAESNPGTFFRYVSGFNNNKIINVVGNNYQIESFNPQTSKFEPTSEAVINQLKNGSRLAYNRITKKLFYFDGYNFIHVATVKDDTINTIESKIAEIDSKVDSISTQVSNTGVPKGTVIDWYGDASFDNIPYGWVPCGGFFKTSTAGNVGVTPNTVIEESNKWTSRYPDLVAVYTHRNTGVSGTYCGLFIKKVNGISVPNLSGRFAVGAGIAELQNIGDYELSDTGGVKEVTLTAAQSGLPAHNHTGYFKRNDAGAAGGAIITASAGGHDNQHMDIFIDNNEAKAATESHENRPPYYALWKLIKVI